MQESAEALPTTSPQLSQSLQARHVSMISIGGMIGAGLFVGSSAAIVATGPAIVHELSVSRRPDPACDAHAGRNGGSTAGGALFTEFTRVGLGNGAGLCDRLALLVLLGLVVPIEAIAGRRTCCTAGCHYHRGKSARADGGDDRGQPDVGAFYARVRVLVRLDQGRRDYRFYLHGGLLLLWLDLPGGPTWGNLTAYGGFMPFGLRRYSPACRSGLLLADRRRNHDDCRGRIHRADPRRGPIEQCGDLADPRFLRRVDIPDCRGRAMDARASPASLPLRWC